MNALQRKLQALNNKLNYMINHAKEFSRSIIAGVVIAIARLESLIESLSEKEIDHKECARQITFLVNGDRYRYQRCEVRASYWDKKDGETRVYLNGYCKKAGGRVSLGYVIVSDDGELWLSRMDEAVRNWMNEIIDSVDGRLVPSEGRTPIVIGA